MRKRRASTRRKEQSIKRCATRPIGDSRRASGQAQNQSLHYNNPMLRDFRLRLMDLYNRLDYPLRQAFHWRRGKAQIVNEPKENLFHYLPPEERTQTERQAQRLQEEYHLDWLYANSRAENYRENLFYLALWESAFRQSDAAFGDELCCADVGSSSWFYVQALHGFLCWYRTQRKRTVRLYGYECDAYRVYADLRSRYDHALAYLNDLKEVYYIPKAFTPQPERFDVIFLMFPFVFLRDHLEWGLPASQFNPQKLLADVRVSLKKEGVLLIINQGEAEHNRQKELLEEAGLSVKLAFRFDSPFFSYPIDRYVILSTHPS